MALVPSARGVRNPRPELVSRIQAALAADPRISKAELARRVGITRVTLRRYLAALPELLREASSRNEQVKKQAALDHLGLIERVTRAADDARALVDGLRSQPLTPACAAACFKGFSTLERLWRLLGELIGEVSPPTTNVYIDKVEALLSGAIDPGSLPAALRGLHSGDTHGSS